MAIPDCRINRYFFSDQQTDRPIWVLGGGKFGKRAIDLLRRELPSAAIVLVEKRPSPDLPDDIEIVCADGAAWLAENFSETSVAGRIIPALPLHLAAEWLKRKLNSEGVAVTSLSLPEQMLRQFPHPLRQGLSQAVISYADFLCPPYCEEPENHCTATGKPRPLPLYRLPETIDTTPFTPLMIRSRQFAPGVGGFFPEDLWHLFNRAISLPDTPLLIGTACRCHGIIDGLSLTKRQ
jgi:hypothetical protein